MSSMNVVHRKTDRTDRAVTAQLQAMGCERYEIGVKATQGGMMQRTWSASEFAHGIAWLKRVNAQGHDIYIRPAGSVGLILADDLDAAALEHLKSDGLAPAVIVETSPGNYQAWLRISQEPIPPEQATAAARIVAERYGSDTNSADWRHFGRLAGFTNRKQKHRQTNGMQPFVLLIETQGVAAERGAQLLQEAKAHLRAVRETPAASQVPSPLLPTPNGLQTPGEAYAHYAARIIARYPNADYSRLDWMVCRDIASGNLAVDEPYLQQALRDGSPHLAERKAGHLEDYVVRTASKVMHDSGVCAARKSLASQGRLTPVLPDLDPAVSVHSRGV